MRRRLAPPPHATERDPERSTVRRPPRRRSRRRVRVVLVALVVVTVFASLQWVERTSYLRVQGVSVVGNIHESTGAVVDAAGLQMHPTMLGLTASSVAAHLGRFAWIRHVALEKNWPHHVTLRITETTPMAVATDGHRWVYVDSRGRNLGSAPSNANLPTLSYVGTLHAWPFTRAAYGAVRVTSTLPKAFAGQVRTVSEDANGNVSLTLTSPVTFLLGPATDLHAKFVAIASVIRHATLRAGDLVDVSVPDEVAVTPPK